MITNNTAGVWPVMLTPFTDGGEIDYRAVDSLVDWYIESGVAGLFAICQSSEMFYLSLNERLKLAEHIKKRSAVPVIASGHVSDSPAAQVEELNGMAQTGVDAVIMISNRQAQEGDSQQRWIEGMQFLLDRLPNGTPLGLYECPFPYKCLLTDDELVFCAQTGRFRFLKDTSCNAEIIKHRISLLKGTPLKLYNANTSTLLTSLQAGGKGFSGVMANFHPDLYVWLCRNWQSQPELAQKVQAGLTIASMIERQCYPNNAKLHLKQMGVIASEYCRVRSENAVVELYRDEVAQLATVAEMLRTLITEKGL